MLRDHDKKEMLLSFLDRRAFDPILEALPEQYSSERDRMFLRDVQQRTALEKERFHRYCSTARQVRDNYYTSIFLQSNERVSRELEDLELPRFLELRSQFSELCSDLGVN